MIILMAGLPATGKSTLAHALAPRINATILNKDAVRAGLFAPVDIEYSTAQDDFVFGIMLQVAGYLLDRGRSRPIILDGRPFSKRYQIEDVIRFAEGIGETWRILECVCSDETARRRLEESAGGHSHPALNRDFNLYVRLKQQFEPITLPKSLMDTDQPLATCVQQALVALENTTA